MFLVLFIAIIIIYISGVFIYVHTETIENAKFHKGGFLGLGYTTHDNREATPSDVRMGLIWPALLIIFFIKTTIWLVNADIIPLIFLLFGANYKNTKIYKIIDEKFE